MPKLSIPSPPTISPPSLPKLNFRKKKSSNDTNPTEDLSVKSGVSKSSSVFRSKFSRMSKSNDSPDVVVSDPSINDDVSVISGVSISSAAIGSSISQRRMKTDPPEGAKSADADVATELFNVDSSATVSKKASFRSKLHLGKKKKKKVDDDLINDSSVKSGASRFSTSSIRSRLRIPSRTKKNNCSDDISILSDDQSYIQSVGSVGNSLTSLGMSSSTGLSSSNVSKPADRNRLEKDAKSRFELGLVYMKTLDFAKAQDNLEHSMYCYVQLYGHDGLQYTNDVKLAVAGIRENLGDCYIKNPGSTDNGLAMDHYEESRRLLESISPEDTPENIDDMLKTVDGKIEELVSSGIPRRPARAPSQVKKIVASEADGDGGSVVCGASVKGATSLAGSDGALVAASTATEVVKTSSRTAILKSKLAAQAGKSKLAGKLKLSKKFDENPFNDDEPDPEHDQLLSDIASELLRNLEIKDHTNGMTTYHACFVGTEAVDFMVNSELASSREEAVKVGNEMQKAGYFEHVAGADNFKDDVTFYHFKGPTISNEFVEAIDEMELGNHSNATDILTAVRDGGSLMNADFREEWYSCTAQVADSALQAGKVSLATMSYEAMYSVLKKYDDSGHDLMLAVKGCIKGHKLSAIESESIKDITSAIKHRTRMYELLIADYHIIAACRQLLKIAHLHGEENDYSSAASTVTDAIERLSSGVGSLDDDPPSIVSREELRQFVHSCGMAEIDDEELNILFDTIDTNNSGELSLEEVMCYFHALQGVNKDDFGKMVGKFLKGPKDRLDLLGHCHKMLAVCCSKMMKLMEASEHYSQLLTLLTKTKSKDSREYNSALIQKAALSVMLKNYHVAHDEITQYETHVTGDNSDLIVDDSDHLLALDTSATIYLKLGNTDKAIQIFESKLAFLKTLNDNEEMRSDTIFKLGCLLAYKGQPNAALPLLNEALDVRKRLYDGTSKSVLESTWAVAATNQILGIVGKSIEEYSVILDKMDVFDKSFTVLVHNSAGKLFTENEKEDEAINCYRRALLAAETPEMEAEISLNLANALSSADDGSKPMEIYDRILETKLVEETKLHYWTQFDKSLLLIKMGEVASATEILDEIADTTSELADDVRVGVYIASGNIALSKKRFDDALNCFGNALVVVQDSDVESIAQAKKLIGLTYSAMGQLKNAITSFERALVGLSDKEECKSANLLKADVWSLMSQVYQKMGDLPQAKRFGELGKHYFSSLLCKITTFSSISILSLFVQHCRLTSLNWVRRTLVPQEVSQIFNCFTWKRQKACPLMRARQFLRLQSSRLRRHWKQSWHWMIHGLIGLMWHH